ncbi:MAG: hypothetical protein RL376_341 [Verrucomicrobiota bacterium]|jgi:uncharacterized protein (DUF2062 family)
MTADEHHHRRLHFARIRRAKFWLKFMPRRARFHTYPVVGRFAAFARKRSYLWSFNYAHIRPALYLGSVLTLLPVLGQVPIAFVLCLLFRANFMLLGGIQFLSNMLTFPFIIAATLKVGFFVIELTGLDRFTGIIPGAFSSGLGTNHEAASTTATSISHKVVLYGSALTIGSIICGLLLGAALDLLWCRFMAASARHRLARNQVTATVTPHDTTLPPSS